MLEPPDSVGACPHARRKLLRSDILNATPCGEMFPDALR